MTVENTANIKETVYNELTADLDFLPYKDFVHDEMDGQSRVFDNENPCDILNVLSLYSRASLMIQENLSPEATSAARSIQDSLLDQATITNQTIMETINQETMSFYDKELEAIVLTKSSKDYPLNYRKWDFNRDSQAWRVCDALEQLVHDAHVLRQQIQQEQPNRDIVELNEESLRYFLNSVSRTYESVSDEQQPKNIIISSQQWHPSHNGGDAAIFNARIDGDPDQIVRIDKDNNLFFSYMYADKQHGTTLVYLPVPKSTTVHFSPGAEKILAQNKSKKLEKKQSAR